MIRRFLTRIFLLILIAACGCNWMQTQQLRGQVAVLELQARQPKQTVVVQPSPASRPSFYLPTFSPIHSLQERWIHLQNRAGVFRSTRKKVLSYVKL